MMANIFSWSDNSYWVLQTVSLVLVGLTVVAGGLAIIVGKAANARQADKILELERGNIDAQKAVEDERSKRVEMEKTLAPRGLSIAFGDPKAKFNVLPPFKGMQVIVRFLPDREARRAAGNISFALAQAGWKILEQKPDPSLEDMDDGVVVESYSAWLQTAEHTPTEEQQAADKYSKQAAEALIDFLTSEPNNWEAAIFPNQLPDVPPNTVRIKIGFKPDPYFDPQWVKDSRKKWKKVKEQSKELEEKFDKLSAPK